MKTIPLHPCPLVSRATHPDLSDSDRRCHVPLTRIWFKKDHPNTPCSKEGQCQACQVHPTYATQEQRLRELLALPNIKYRRKRTPAHA